MPNHTELAKRAVLLLLREAGAETVEDLDRQSSDVLQLRLRQANSELQLLTTWQPERLLSRLRSVVEQGRRSGEIVAADLPGDDDTTFWGGVNISDLTQDLAHVQPGDPEEAQGALLMLLNLAGVGTFDALSNVDQGQVYRQLAEANRRSGIFTEAHLPAVVNLVAPLRQGGHNRKIRLYDIASLPGIDDTSWWPTSGVGGQARGIISRLSARRGNS